MKILRLYPFLPPCRGGVELHVKNLTEQQRLMGHEVTVLFNEGTNTHPQDKKLAHSLQLRRVRPQFLRDVLFYAFALCHCLRNKQHTDAIHAHGDWSAFLMAIVLAKFTRAKVRVASIHGEVGAGLRRYFYRRILSHFDIVYCTGNREVKLLRKLGIRQSYWQPSGVSDEFSGISQAQVETQRSIDVICVANLIPVKNLALLMQVAQRLPQYRFEVIGDGPLREQLIAKCASLGVGNLRFAGGLSHSKLATRLSSARVFYLPSLTEGTPTAMMEAMTLALPVVVTPSNDYNDMIRQGINGFVTQDFSVESSVQALSKLLTDPELMARISRQNQADSSRFTWPAIATRVSKWMQEPEKS